MARRDETLVAQIEAEALDENKPVAGALRKCVALGGQAGSSELRDWATQELRGYPPDAELPEFRVVPAPIYVDGAVPGGLVKNQQIPRSTLPDFVQEKVDEEFKFYSGIGEIEELMRSAEQSEEPAKLQLPMGGDIARIMTAESGQGQQIISIYWAISPVALRAVCDQVRTSLVQLVAELRAATPRGQAIPSPEAATQAVNVVLHGKRSQVVVNAPQAAGGGTASVITNDEGPEESEFWTRSRRIGAFVVGLASIAGAVAAIVQLS